MQADNYETKTHPFAQSKENLNDQADGGAARPEKPVCKPEFLEGKIWIAEGFDNPLDDLFECMDKKKYASIFELKREDSFSFLVPVHPV